MEHDSNPMEQCVQVALRAIIGPVLALMLLTVEAVSAEIRVSAAPLLRTRCGILPRNSSGRPATGWSSPSE